MKGGCYIMVDVLFGNTESTEESVVESCLCDNNETCDCDTNTQSCSGNNDN